MCTCFAHHALRFQIPVFQHGQALTHPAGHKILVHQLGYRGHARFDRAFSADSPLCSCPPRARTTLGSAPSLTERALVIGVLLLVVLVMLRFTAAASGGQAWQIYMNVMALLC
jgi:hypothetical protein